jgi:hypothetical protein
MKKLILEKFKSVLVNRQTVKSIKGGYDSGSDPGSGSGSWHYAGHDSYNGVYTYDAYNPVTGQFICHLTYSQFAALCSR